VFADVARDHDATPVQASILLVIYNQPGIDRKTLAERSRSIAPPPGM
jgi:hypothetical protein